MAYNGKDAVEKTNKKGYNIILMDNNMPVMSGIEATRQIRTMKQIQQPKIISISSDSDEKTVQAIQQSGINAHLLKPITKDKLLDAIASLLATKEMINTKLS